MSKNRNFLPNHPKIIKKVQQSPSASFQNSRILNKSSQFDNEIIDALINRQKYEVQNLKSMVQQLSNKNSLMQSSLTYYNNQTQKKSLAHQIQTQKQSQQDIIQKIANCQKVQKTTSPEQYYLWQKKKKLDQYNKKIQSMQHENEKQREQIKQLRQQYKHRIMESKQEIQQILHEIEIVQGEFKDQEMEDDNDFISREKMAELKQEYEGLVATTAILKENNQILTTQLEEGIQSIELVLKKSFQNSRSALIRQLQSIKKQIQNSQPSSSIQNPPTTSPTQSIDQYTKKLQQIHQLLSPQQAQQATRIIRPLDWQSLKWQQYLDIQNTQQINYMQKFELLTKQHEKYQKELESMQKQMQQLINQSVSITQKNIQIQSATINLVKIFQFGKK